MPKTLATWHHAHWAGVPWRVLLTVVLWGLGLGNLYSDGHQPPPTQAMAAGHQAWQRGDATGAVSQWQAAVQGYAALQQTRLQSQALTYLARAYEALGHTDRADASLQQAMTLAEAAGDRAQVALIFGTRGELATAVGKAVEAEKFLEEARSRAYALQDAGLVATILHAYGNWLMLQQRWPDAMLVYRESAQWAQQARQFGIAARALAHAAMAAEPQPALATEFLDEALVHLQQSLPSHEKVYDLLSIGLTYQRLAPHHPDGAARAATVLLEAVHIAQTLEDVRALSYAWGYLGRLYADAQRDDEAFTLTQRAVRAAQQVVMPESLYLWQWQTARLLYRRGELVDATAAYEQAIMTVQDVRRTLLPGYEPASASFRTAIGTLYFELAEVFLRRAVALEAHLQGAIFPQYDWYLRQARAVVEQFKTAELREYFGDACVDTARSGMTGLDHLAPATAVIYPILLPERTEFIVSLPTGLQRFAVQVSSAQWEQHVRAFRHAVEERDTFRSLRHAQQLYAWLIEPYAAVLAAQHIRTLVLVPDGVLRLLPLAALHNGQQFLIERYALAITPSLTLTEPRPLGRERVRVLAAGVAKAVEEFAPLPKVPVELRNLQQLFGGTVLLDQAFSPARLEQTVRQGQFGILHIASHGRFAARAEESFLLTAQGKLTLERLAEIIGGLRFREQPLELLTLSACDTAQGDERATLGLAGVAVQAGARSALATLWRVADTATTEIMSVFYRALRTSEVSKAEALQQAQLHLLRHSAYQEPFFWAPFLLINNWL